MKKYSVSIDTGKTHPLLFFCLFFNFGFTNDLLIKFLLLYIYIHLFNAKTCCED